MSTWLNSQDISDSIQRGRLIATVDWYGGFVGLLVCVALCLVSTVFIVTPVTKFGQLASLPFFLLFGFLSIYGVFCLTQERKLLNIDTGLGVDENHKLVNAACQRLSWGIWQNNNHVIQAGISGKWYSASYNAVILIADHTVYLNIMNLSKGTKGRFPFSFGTSKKHLNLLVDAIKSSLHLSE
jgi:hypothetical protein